MKENLVLNKIEAGIKESSAFIAKEIAENAEKYGVSPVISIDGKLKNLSSKALNFGEIENMTIAIKQYGYCADDFYFYESKNIKYGKDKLFIIAGFIICIFKKSGKIKEYKAVKNHSWFDEFIGDLKAQIFN